LKIYKKTTGKNMFRFWQKNNISEREAAIETTPLLNDLENPEEKTLGYFNKKNELPETIDQNILLFLKPEELAGLLRVNKYWSKQINHSFIYHSSFRKNLFNLLTSNPKKLAQLIRGPNIQYTLSRATNYEQLATLRAIYNKVRTQVVAQGEPLYPHGFNFIKNWLADVHNVIFANARLPIKPANICNQNIIPLLICIATAISLKINCVIKKNKLNKLLSNRKITEDLREKIYQEIDDYLPTLTTHVNNQTSFILFEQAKNNNELYGVSATADFSNWCPHPSSAEYLPITRDGRNQNCISQPFDLLVSRHINYCYKYDHRPIPFSYIAYTQQLHNLTNQCSNLNSFLNKINQKLGSYLNYGYLPFHKIEKYEAYENIKNQEKWIGLPIFFSALMLLIWMARAGVFQSIKNIDHNRRLNNFFKEAKPLLTSAEGAFAWKDKLEKIRQEDQQKPPVRRSC